MIYIVRHGQTNDNKNHIIQGNKPMNGIGKEQVRKTAKTLKRIKFHVCFCSPLKRTRQTLKIFKIYKKNMPVFFDERLKERYYGNLVGKCYDNIQNYTQTRWNANHVLDESVENPEQLYDRVKNFYADKLSNYKGKNVLIITHSGIARMSYYYFTEKPKDRNYTNFEIKNAHILQIEN